MENYHHEKSKDWANRTARMFKTRCLVSHIHNLGVQSISKLRHQRESNINKLLYRHESLQNGHTQCVSNATFSRSIEREKMPHPKTGSSSRVYVDIDDELYPISTQHAQQSLQSWHASPVLSRRSSWTSAQSSIHVSHLEHPTWQRAETILMQKRTNIDKKNNHPSHCPNSAQTSTQISQTNTIQCQHQINSTKSTEQTSNVALHKQQNHTQFSRHTSSTLPQNCTIGHVQDDSRDCTETNSTQTYIVRKRHSIPTTHSKLHRQPIYDPNRRPTDTRTDHPNQQPSIYSAYETNNLRPGNVTQFHTVVNQQKLQHDQEPTEPTDPSAYKSTTCCVPGAHGNESKQSERIHQDAETMLQSRYSTPLRFVGSRESSRRQSWNTVDDFCERSKIMYEVSPMRPTQHE